MLLLMTNHPILIGGGEQAFLDLGFSTTEADSTDSAILITISSDEVEKNLGGWPGKVPEIPEGMLTRVSE